MPVTDRPVVLVLFGATGDLARRELYPALTALAKLDRLPARFRLVGTGRHSPGTDEEFRADLAGDLDDAVFRDRIAPAISFVPSSDDDGDDLARAVAAAVDDLGDDTRKVIYLSVPPEAMTSMVEMLGVTGLADGADLVVEKPFGSDLASARKLNEVVRRVVGEERVYRIDHFTGKAPARTLLADDRLPEPAAIASVQIDVPERIALEGRGAFLESTGTFRDMISTHLCQILGFVAVEPPAPVEHDTLRRGLLEVFQALQPFDPARTVFGQYAGYRDEDGVDDDSRVETFVALEARIDDDRWRDVPFHLRTGKALTESRQVVTVVPRDGDAEPVQIDLHDDEEPGAYGRLLEEVLAGDRTYFVSGAEVERLWEVCAPILDHPPTAQEYEQGSWGPREASELPGDTGWAVSR